MGSSSFKIVRVAEIFTSIPPALAGEPGTGSVDLTLLRRHSCQRRAVQLPKNPSVED